MFANTAAVVLALAASMAAAIPMEARLAPQEAARAVSENPASVLERAAHNGLGTVYLQGGVAGSCGVVHADSTLIGALGNAWMNNQYKSPYCGRKIKLTNTGSNDGVGGKGKSVTITVQDTCQACDGNHIDLSVGAWNALTGNAAYGTVNINWDFA